MRPRIWALTAPALLAAFIPVEAQTKKNFPLQVHGFLLGTGAVRTTGMRPPGGVGGDFVLGETRLRIDATGATNGGAGFLQFKGDLFHDAVENRLDGEIREGYAGFTAGELDVRVGRQIVTWGVGDLFFHQRRVSKRLGVFLFRATHGIPETWC